MKRRISGLHDADRSPDEVNDGLYLLRVDRAQYRWHVQKPYYLLRFTVLEPKHLAGRSIAGRIYCTARAMWKLSWFLRDFGYDTELLGRDEIDDKGLIGLRGVVKISHVVRHGLRSFRGVLPRRRTGHRVPRRGRRLERQRTA